MKLMSFFLLLFMLGCAEQPTNASAVQQHYLGRYVYGHEVSSFKSCDSTRVFWLNGEAQAMAKLKAAAMQLAEQKNSPYQPIYIHFAGKQDMRDPIGFEDEYDGIIHLTSLQEYSLEIPATCL